MSSQKIEISRPLVGVLTLACLVAAAAVWAFGASQKDAPLWIAGFLRVGILLGALWLALPTASRAPAWANVSPWTLVGLLLMIYLVGRYKWAMIPVLVTVATIGFFLRPREKRRPQARS
jgi:hypothetical protein